MPAESTAAAAPAEGDRLVELLEQSAALLTGHFALSSGLHSERYVQCARLLEDPARARAVGRALAERLRPHRPGVIASPALGGLIIGYEVASALGLPFRFTERKGGRMTLRRGFEIADGEQVAIVEDVVTTGKSTLEAASVVTERGGFIVAIGAIIDRTGGPLADRTGGPSADRTGGPAADRTGGASPFEVPFAALTRLSFGTWAPEECPLCAAGSEPHRPGSRAPRGG